MLTNSWRSLRSSTLRPDTSIAWSFLDSLKEDSAPSDLIDFESRPSFVSGFFKTDILFLPSDALELELLSELGHPCYYWQLKNRLPRDQERVFALGLSFPQHPGASCSLTRPVVS